MKKFKASISSPKRKRGRQTAASAPAKFQIPNRWVGALVAAFLLTLLIIQIPREPVTTALDPSWGAVLDYAHAENLQFGRNIVFTYGPLGYLMIGWFTGHGTGLRMVFDLLFGFAIAVGVCLVAWRTSVGWRILLVGLFVLLPATIRPGMVDVPLEIGFFCWALLCYVETGSRVKFLAVILTVFTVISSLVKFTFLVLSMITIVAIAVDFLVRGKGRQGGVLVIGYLAGLFCAWILLGQAPLHFGDYLKGSMAISTGYESAMGLQFGESAWTAGFVSALLALAVAVIRLAAAEHPATRRTWLRRILFLGWLFCILFLVWKHGFLRAKSDLWAGFVALVALALDALPVAAGRRTAIWAARGCAIACCLLALTIENLKEPDHFKNIAAREAGRLGDNTLALLSPGGYAREMNKTLDAERARAQLPRLRTAIGRATVDVFGQNQAYALFNGLNYRPRPVFQSYSAYNATLMELNDRAFASDAAPEFVLFSLGAIDGRFPPLEDARTLRTLLADYTLVDAENPFLLLKRQPSAAMHMTLLHAGVVRVNEPISVTEYGDVDLWLEISIKPSVEGWLRQVLYKPTEVYLAVSGQSNTQVAKFRAPVPMLAAGFLASPVLLQTQDVMDLYTGNDIHRPGGYAILLSPGSGNMWQQQIQYRIFRIDTKLGRNSSIDPGRMSNKVKI